MIVFVQIEQSVKNVKHFSKFFPDHGKIICDEQGYNTFVQQYWPFPKKTTFFLKLTFRAEKNLNFFVKMHSALNFPDIGSDENVRKAEKEFMKYISLL